MNSTTIIKTIFLAALVLIMAQGCIPTTPIVNPTPFNLAGKIKKIQLFSYPDGFPSSFTLETNFTYDSINGKPSGINIVRAGTLVGKYTISEELNKITVTSLTGYEFSQYRITKTTCFIQPNTKYVDSIIQTTNDTILNNRTIFKRNNLNQLIRIDEFNSVTSNLSHIIYDNFIYNNENITSYRNTDAYNNVFNLSFNYDLTKNQKPFTNSYLTNFLVFGYLEGYGGEGSFGNITEFLGLSYGKMSVNLITSFSEEEPGFGYEIYTSTTVKTNIIRFSTIFNPSLYFNKYTINTYY